MEKEEATELIALLVDWLDTYEEKLSRVYSALVEHAGYQPSDAELADLFAVEVNREFSTASNEGPTFLVDEKHFKGFCQVIEAAVPTCEFGVAALLKLGLDAIEELHSSAFGQIPSSDQASTTRTADMFTIDALSPSWWTEDFMNSSRRIRLFSIDFERLAVARFGDDFNSRVAHYIHNKARLVGVEVEMILMARRLEAEAGMSELEVELLRVQDDVVGIDKRRLEDSEIQQPSDPSEGPGGIEFS